MKLFQSLGCLLAILACGLPSKAQSYQTSFGEIHFDRGKSPSTWHGVTDVETASGALNIKIPLGPGIGARGLKWVPTLKGHWAPLVTTKASYNTGDYTLPPYTYTQTASNGEMGLEPGYLRFVLGNFMEDNTEGGPTLCATDYDDAFSCFRTPDGYSGSFLVSNNPDVPVLTGYVNPQAMTGSPVSAVNPVAVAKDFGFLPDQWSIAPEIGSMVNSLPPTAGQFVRMGQGGELIIGLTNPSNPLEVCDPIVGSMGGGSSTPDTWLYYPSKILVVRGEEAYEYTYSKTTLSNVCHLDDNNLDHGVRFFKWGYFVLTSIRNRQGDSILFTRDATNYGNYTAEWLHLDWQTDTFQGIQVQYQYSNGPESPANVTVSYTGSGSQPTFAITNLRHLGPGSSSNGSADADPTAGMVADSVTDLGTNQTIGFTLAPAPLGLSDTYIISAVSMPGRNLTFNWTQYQYFRNRSQTPGYASAHYYVGSTSLPNYCWGVTQVTDTDTTGSGPSASRVTFHNRKIPQPNLADMYHWLSTAHYDLVTHPDDSATLYRFVEPPNDGSQGTPGASTQAQIQALASLKHQVAEVRFYETTALARADVTTAAPAPLGSVTLVPLASSSAYKAELHEGFSLCDISNPTGLVSAKAVPYPTHHRTWIRDCGALQETYLDQWDPTTDLQWQVTRSLWDIAPAPVLNTDVRAFVAGGPALSLPAPVSGRRVLEQRTFGTNAAYWHWGRVSQKAQTVQADNGPGHDPNVGLGSVETPDLITYNPVYDRVDQVTKGPLPDDNE
jgi:hypothetical protein